MPVRTVSGWVAYSVACGCAGRQRALGGAQAPLCTCPISHQTRRQILTPAAPCSAAISFVDDDLEFHGKPVMSTVVVAVYRYRLLMAQPSLCHQAKCVGGV